MNQSLRCAEWRRKVRLLYQSDQRINFEPAPSTGANPKQQHDDVKTRGVTERHLIQRAPRCQACKSGLLGGDRFQMGQAIEDAAGTKYKRL
jgi:hypothetical protein